MSKYATKKYYCGDLMNYTKLNPKEKYFIVYIQNRLMNNLKKKWGRYMLDNELKNIFYKDSYYKPTQISKSELYHVIRRCIQDNCDNYINTIHKLDIDSINDVDKIII